MSLEIQTLPDEVVDLIAAGEVIDSLAAVVRELVENSLDAGANRITIALNPELWQVQVIDNGKGMSLEDLRICAQPHSTSKIRTSQDLWHITSLGFRGEALHSIAQVAELTICSRANCSNTVGWKVTYQEAKSEGESVVAIATGTIVTVSNLFAKIPVRRRGLPPLSQQLKTIQKLIYQIALCHPQVTWRVKQNNSLWFAISPGTTAKDVLPQFLRRVNSSDLHYLKVDLETPAPKKEQDLSQFSVDQLTHSHPTQPRNAATFELISSPRNLRSNERQLTANKSQIELVLGLPDRCHRHRADWVKVSVNNRFVRSPELEQTILNSMAKTLPRNRFPVCLLHLHTCPSQVDWNRHPAKSEIYLHSLSYWQAETEQAISQALKLNTVNLPVAVGDRRIGKILKVAEASRKYQIDRQLTAKLEATNTSSINSLKLKAVAQVNKTYIVAEHASGVWLVEQHIAHERVLYEQLQDCWELVPLKSSITLEHLRPQQIEQLRKLEIETELFGENIWAIRNAPKVLAERDDCADALIELSWGGDLRSAQVATACRSAIRNGTNLSLEQMQNLLNSWQAARNPRTCPHGRPIYLSLEESSLSRFFRRHWVIGKSHGI
ncbi:DNA mismatch repair endonuclease MutL [Pleurocapsales cyanobacterium LEGE 10410]|nr:DNA mismatch repair endonuclease MutL [Pleurocapsales cyanobacterium LEGE 10410]